MKTNSPKDFDPVAALSLFLPSGILDYFTLVSSVSQEACFILSLEEKAAIPSELCHLSLHSKGFFQRLKSKISLSVAKLFIYVSSVVAGKIRQQVRAIVVIGI